MSDLERRKDIGEKCMAAAMGTGVCVEGEDRETAAIDAISDILTALVGPAGYTEERDGRWHIVMDDDAIEEAARITLAALRSWQGDAEDYEAD